MGRCDKWTVLRIFEVLFVVACLVYKRVTDDEARSVFLYLQKLSREWSLLQNVTWDRVGSSVADATFGGYTIITVALLLGKLFGELPTRKRVMEWTFLFVGAVLFIAIGSLAYASIDSVPQHLVDNAAILGTLSIITGALFLIDMGSPKKRKPRPPTPPVSRKGSEPVHPPPDVSAVQIQEPPKRSITEQVYDIEREVERSERTTHQPQVTPTDREVTKELGTNGVKNGEPIRNGRATTAQKIEQALKEPPPNLVQRSYIGYKPMQDEEFEIPKRFGIYGKDVTDYGNETDETASIPPKIELHTPVWGNIRKETAQKYYIPPSSILPLRVEAIPESDSPNGLSKLDPGYVHYTAEQWGKRKNGTKTPQNSPTTDL